MRENTFKWHKQYELCFLDDDVISFLMRVKQRRKIHILENPEKQTSGKERVSMQKKEEREDTPLKEMNSETQKKKIRKKRVLDQKRKGREKS